MDQTRHTDVDAHTAVEVRRVQVQRIHLVLDQVHAAAVRALAHGEVFVAAVGSATTENLVVVERLLRNRLGNDRHSLRSRFQEPSAHHL